MLDKRYREIAGVMLMLLSLLVFLSLASYDIKDYQRLSGREGVSNLIGPVGALMSHGARSAFGLLAYMFVLILAIPGAGYFKNAGFTDNLERISTAGFITVSFSSLAAMLYPETPQLSGGFVGLYLHQFFRGLFGSIGSILVISIFCFTGLILAGLVSVSSLIERGADGRAKINFSKLKLKAGLKFWRDDIPLNRISDDLKKPKKRPWIEKKTILIYKDGTKRFKENIRSSTPLIRLPYPLPSGQTQMDESFEPIIKMENKIYREKYLSVTDESAGPDIPAIPPQIENLAEPQIVIPAFEGVAVQNEEINFSEPIYPAIADESAEPADDEAIPLEDFTIEEIPVSRNRFTGISLDGEAAPTDGNRLSEPHEDEDKNTKTVYTRQPAVFTILDLNSKYAVPTDYLSSTVPIDTASWKIEVQKNSLLLVNTLNEFGIESRVTAVNRGPVITLYEMQIAPGIKLNKITGLSDDIAMALAAYRVRIVAPIPGKSAIGIEIPNRDRESVTLGDIVKSEEFKIHGGSLKVILGKDILGKPVMLDLKKMPHLLIAGATGSGKSVCVNSLITSLVYNYDPNYLRFIMVDPKMVELQLYNGLPHLLTPVITDTGMAPNALKWLMYEMERRYRLLSALNTRDIERYNQKADQLNDGSERLPYIVTIIDELADLMMVSSKEVEGYITRIAQKARAVGIHLVLATQRPSVDVITGIIKANFPARIAFQVAQKTDSRTIIDQNGAEKLLGKGDMLYQSPVSSFPVRIQGAFISEDEIMSIVAHLRKLGKPDYIDIEESLFNAADQPDEDSDNDELFIEAMKIVEETRKASASYLQRRLSIGYNRAARIIELMEDRGYIGPQQGSKPRDVYI